MWLEFTAASKEYERALALAPEALRIYGTTPRSYAIAMGHGDSAGCLAPLRRAVALDPLNFPAHNDLGVGLYLLR